MKPVPLNHASPHLHRHASLLCWGLLTLLCFTATGSLHAAPLVFLSPPAAPSNSMTQITLTNCDDPGFNYILQVSSDLQNWSSIYTHSPVDPTNILVALAPATNDACYYRALAIPRVPLPMFNLAITTKTNLYLNGKKFLGDSFDSADTNYSSIGTNAVQYYGTNVVQIYDATKAKAGCDIAVNGSVAGSVFLGNAYIYGHLITGFGDESTVVHIGPNGSVGDFSWIASNIGIEGDGTADSWWQPGFYATLPDVKIPTSIPPWWVFTWSALPAADSHGNTVLNGGNYSTTSSSVGNLLITGPTTLWVQGSASLGVTIAGTNGSLMLYVGKDTGSGDTITLSGNGTMNTPGYARNLQIYGLPSLTSIDMHVNASWIAAIYAPKADVFLGGGGNSTQDAAGAIVCKSLSLMGHFNFHYDESLKTNGPYR
ncbi:MAG: hypothetical protein JWR19_3547 [Pedosphaera sp.]|nr:hypothetical protein [Pedosphaera sp.]